MKITMDDFTPAKGVRLRHLGRNTTYTVIDKVQVKVQLPEGLGVWITDILYICESTGKLFVREASRFDNFVVIDKHTLFESVVFSLRKIKKYLFGSF